MQLKNPLNHKFTVLLFTTIFFIILLMQLKEQSIGAEKGGFVANDSKGVYEICYA